MPLTDEQWRLIAPLLPGHSPFARGRPPFNPRHVMEGVLCKLRFGIPWYDLPDYYPHQASSTVRPSWQTCYRAYRLWRRRGIMDQVYRFLFRDLRDRGGTDLFQLIEEGVISLDWNSSGQPEILPNEYLDTWQSLPRTSCAGVPPSSSLQT